MVIGQAHKGWPGGTDHRHAQKIGRRRLHHAEDRQHDKGLAVGHGRWPLAQPCGNDQETRQDQHQPSRQNRCLTHIAGLNRNVAQQIVNYRKEHGAFANREALKDVPRLGVKTFEQAAGFLRIRDGDNPLDATGVHPESYELVNSLLEHTNKDLSEIIGNDGVLNSIDTSAIAANEDNINALGLYPSPFPPLSSPASIKRFNPLGLSDSNCIFSFQVVVTIFLTIFYIFLKTEVLNCTFLQK